MWFSVCDLFDMIRVCCSVCDVFDMCGVWCSVFDVFMCVV